MTAVEIKLDERGRVVPLVEQIDPLADETPTTYTDRVLSHARAAGTRRQCSIGYHEECSDPAGESCRCACHPWPEELQAAPIIMGQREATHEWIPGHGWQEVPDVVEVYLDALGDLVKALRSEVRSRAEGTFEFVGEMERVDDLVKALGLDDDVELEGA